jgi:hypothetical protein
MGIQYILKVDAQKRICARAPKHAKCVLALMAEDLV